MKKIRRKRRLFHAIILLKNRMWPTQIRDTRAPSSSRKLTASLSSTCRRTYLTKTTISLYKLWFINSSVDRWGVNRTYSFRIYFNRNSILMLFSNTHPLKRVECVRRCLWIYWKIKKIPKREVLVATVQQIEQNWWKYRIIWKYWHIYEFLWFMYGK